MKNNTLKLLLALCALTLLCTTPTNASPVGDFFGKIMTFFYTPSGGEYTATDAHGNKLKFDREGSQLLADMTATEMDTYLQAQFKAEYPSDYVGTAPEDIAGISGSVSDLKLDISEKGKQTVGLVDTIIPSGGAALNALLALGGALGSLFYRHKGRRQEKLNLATGRGINDIRDMLDYLPSQHQKVGAEIDGRIKEILSGAHAQAGVTKEASTLVKEVKSVTKRPLTL